MKIYPSQSDSLQEFYPNETARIKSKFSIRKNQNQSRAGFISNPNESVSRLIRIHADWKFGLDQSESRLIRIHSDWKFTMGWIWLVRNEFLSETFTLVLLEIQEDNKIIRLGVVFTVMFDDWFWKLCDYWLWSVTTFWVTSLNGSCNTFRATRKATILDYSCLMPTSTKLFKSSDDYFYLRSLEGR